jgi:uncharacterized membrane protein
MDDHRSWVYEFLFDDVNRTLIILGVSTLLGLGSVLLFFYSPGNSPTRFHLVLLLCAMVILFYLAVRDDPV